MFLSIKSDYLFLINFILEYAWVLFIAYSLKCGASLKFLLDCISYTIMIQTPVWGNVAVSSCGGSPESVDHYFFRRLLQQITDKFYVFCFTRYFERVV